MEAVLTRQQELIQEIEKIYLNFKKDGPSRKTSDYISKRLQSLSNLWIEFEENNINIISSEDESIPYIAEDYYGQTKSYYEGVVKCIKSYKQPEDKPGSSRITFSIPSIPNPKNEDNLDTVQQLCVLQQTNFRTLTRLMNRINSSTIDEKWEIEDELKNLQHRWNVIEELHLKIDSMMQGSDDKYEDEFLNLEQQFIIIKRQLNKKLCSSAHLQQSTPRIDIPVFTGRYTQWPTFLDLFTEAIHNNKYLSNAQKMQHLKGKLKGEAERLIQHLTISTENYEPAWELLNHRYNNTQLLFTNHIEIFLNQPVIHKQSYQDLKKMYDITMESIHAIQNLGIETITWDPLLVHLLSKKLDTETYTDYKESRKAPRELPTIHEFLNFIENKFTALEPIQKRERDAVPKQTYQAPLKPTFQKGQYQPKLQAPSFNPRKTYPIYQNQAISSNGNFRKVTTCPVCQEEHDLYACKQLFSMSPNDVMDTLAKLKVCQNCLYKHFDKKCMSTKRCKVCQERHNTLIHDFAAMTSNLSSINSQHPSTSKQYSTNHVAAQDEEVLLTTLSLKVRGNDGTYVLLRTLLDQGSQVTLLSENAAQLLGLPRIRYDASISGIGPSSRQSKGLVNLECQSIYDDYQFSTQALVVSRVINDLPNATFQRQYWPHLQNIRLADPEYNISRPIDMVLDATVYSDIIMSGLIKGVPEAPIAQQTKLGWILSGNVMKTFQCNVVINSLNNLSKYWEIEDIDETPTLSKEDQFCEDLYQSTTRRLQSGRYEVAIPMQPNYQEHLGHSKSKAKAQFFQLENKITKNDSLSESYKQFMHEYLQLNHMCESSNNNQSNPCYLPHHGVLKLDSTTTKLRVVFNASSKTSTGRSLNDLMECGPNLQKDLLSLIINWRQYKYVLTADIEKMFRQIMVREADQHLQTILWRDSPYQPLKDYHLTTFTYGFKASPYLAMRTLKQIARDNLYQYQSAASALESSFYMDDLLVGKNSIPEAKSLQNDLIKILKNAGMNLRKWSSNSTQLINDLSAEQLDTPFEFKDSDTKKTLGLRWNPKSDTFTYQNISFEDNESTCTKRQLLSNIAKIYDPLGWLSPLTIRGKLLFQQTWNKSLSWDDELPIEIQNEWKVLRKDLSSIESFAIPRYLGQISNNQYKVHGFCDASEKAYSCAIYIVAQNEKGDRTSRLIAAKTKVAPTKKQISLPRLELLGALQLSKLSSKVLSSLSISKDIEVHAWCDSMIVLGWLQGDPGRWKQFISNRTTEITNIIPASNWHHVKSEDNAADCASRGISSSALSNHPLWWKGPAWLCDLNSIPSQKYQEPIIERKNKQQLSVLTTLNNHWQSSFITKLLSNKSSINKVIKIIAWLTRYVSWLRNKQECEQYITSAEYDNALTIIIRTEQLSDFEDDINKLKSQNFVSTKSKLAPLKPFLDTKGILRVGGRLQNADLTYEAKHPIIISPHSRFTALIIQQAHQQTLHGGPKLTLSYIREKYWIISGLRTVKHQLRTCVKCRRFSQESKNQIMADLPEARVSASRPFSNTGVDFTGYVEVKTNKGRGVRTTKGYVAVFVCLSIKAVHLELVSDLSTSSFLAAFRRFCSRRGTPKNMFSDNGTNFVGANRVLRKEYHEILDSINLDYISASDLDVTWHFNAPAWPNAGGLWEAAVKSFKHHLKRVLGEQRLTYEEFNTLLHQIEACMNSRPLCSLSENTDDLALTPGHFLVGGPLLSRPCTDPAISNLSLRWQLVQQMNKQLWRAWSTDYLQQLQTRSKWRRQVKNLEVGDIVIIKEDNMPPGKWAMARVNETHPGKDGLTRVVSLKTQNNIMKRPINKLIELQVSDTNKQMSNQTKTSISSTHISNIPKPAAPASLRTRKVSFKSLFTTMLVLASCVVPTSQQNINTFCEIKTMACANQWIKLQGADAWLYSCCETCAVRLLCPDGSSSHRLRNNGIVTIGQDCTLKGDTYSIHGNHEYENKVNIEPWLYLPKVSSLNYFINTTMIITCIIVVVLIYYIIKGRKSNPTQQQRPIISHPHREHSERPESYRQRTLSLAPQPSHVAPGWSPRTEDRLGCGGVTRSTSVPSVMFKIPKLDISD